MKFETLYSYYKYFLLNEGTEQEDTYTRFLASCSQFMEIIKIQYKNILYNKNFIKNTNIYQYKTKTHPQQHCNINYYITDHSILRFIIRGIEKDVKELYEFNLIKYEENMRRENKSINLKITGDDKPKILYKDYNIENKSYHNIVKYVNDNIQTITKQFQQIINIMISKRCGIHLTYDVDYKILFDNKIYGISTHCISDDNNDKHENQTYLFNLTTIYFDTSSIDNKNDKYYNIDLSTIS